MTGLTLFLWFAGPMLADSFGDPLPPGAAARLGTVRWRHDAAVYAVLYSPDGKTIYTSAHDTVRAWDAATGRESARFDALKGSLELWLSADGASLIGIPSREVVRYDLQSGKTRTLALPENHAGRPAISPDGHTVALSEQGYLGGEWVQQVKLWDLATGKPRALGDKHAGAMLFTPDGKTLIAGVSDSSLRFWDVATGKQRRRLEGLKHHGGPVSGLAITPDGKTLLVVAGDCLHLWDVKTGKHLRRLAGHHGSIYSVAVSADGRRAATTGADRSLRLWDLRGGKELWRAMLLATAPGSAPAFAPDGKTVAVSDGGPALARFDAETGRRLGPRAGHTGTLAALAFSPDGKLLASAGYDRTVCVWDVAAKKRLRVLEHQSPVRVLTFSPDGRLLATGDEFLMCGFVRLWDVATGKQLRRLTVSGTPQLGWRVTAIAFSPDGRRLVARSPVGISAWDLETGKALPEPTKPDERLAHEVLSPDGRFTADWASKWVGADPFTQAATGMGIRPGQTFTAEQTVTIRDTATGAELGRLAYQTQVGPHVPKDLLLPGHGLFRSKLPMEFSPDGRLLLTGGTPQAWEPKQRRLGSLQLLLLTQGTFQVWELASGRRLSGPAAALKGKPATVPRNATFGPDGRTLIVSWPDDSLSLWDAWTGEEVARWRVPPGARLHALSPDGRWLATGHSDTTILLWDVHAKLKEKPQPPARAEDLDALWTDLAADEPARAYRGVARLIAAPEAVSYLKKHLRPAPADREKRVARLIADLDSRRFTERKAATRELKAMGNAATPALLHAIKGKPSLETRRRIEVILAAPKPAGGLVPSGEPLRRFRAVEVLERIGSNEARALLEELAKGAPSARETQEAKAALARLAALGREP